VTGNRLAGSVPVLLAVALALLVPVGCARVPGGTQPGAAAAKPPPGSSPAAGAAPGRPVAPALLPAGLLVSALGCPAGMGSTVSARVNLPGGLRADRPVAGTVVAAHCASAAGSPPSGLFLVSGSGHAARVVGTLVRPASDVLVTALRLEDGLVSASGLGYSSGDVPRCCPDRRLSMAWVVQGDRMVPVHPTAT
jgi:hypothetical protein